MRETVMTNEEKEVLFYLDAVRKGLIGNALSEKEKAIDFAINAIKSNSRPTGKWEKVKLCSTNRVVFRCSICGRLVKDCYRDDLAELYPYCHCGAKMEI